MKIHKFYCFFVLITILGASGCASSSSPKTANLILYPISEYTPDMERITTSVYTVSGKGGEPEKIYQVDAPQELRAWFSPDGNRVVILSWHTVKQPDSTIPGASYTLVTMDSDGKNAITWLKDFEVKYIACTVSAQFSADGKRFLYIKPASKDCEEYQLYTAEAGGGGSKLIDQANQISAEFSPKGDRLLVSRLVRDTVNKKTVSEIYYVNARGGAPEIVWSNPEAVTIASATYGGSDRVLLQVGDFGDGQVELSLVSDDFKKKTPVASFPGIRAYSPTFSNDARYIGLGRMSETNDIFTVIDVSTGEMRDVSAWYQSPFDFSSNGKYLLVSALGSYGDISAVGINQMLLEPNGDLIETLSPPEYYGSMIAPDGKRLAYWTRDSSTRETCLNIRDLETDKVTPLSRTCVAGSTEIPGFGYWR